MTYHILINDGMDKEGLEMFTSEEGFSVTNEFREGRHLIDTIGDFDAFLVRSKTTVTREMIQAGAQGRLRMIGRGGVGVDNIDVNAANEYGIVVKFAPRGVTNSTAEHAFFLAGAVARRISPSNYFLKDRVLLDSEGKPLVDENGKLKYSAGIWRKKPFEGIELSEKIFGLIGCGRIGQAVATKARGIGMEVIGYDAKLKQVKQNFPDSVINYMSREDVLRLADVVSLHTGGKEVIVGGVEIGMMKTGAILINASRGGNVDEEALYNALISGKLYGAGLDTYKGEPKKEGQEVTESMRKLAGLDNVVMTPHLGASTREGQRKTSTELARVTMDYLLKGDYKNSVNTIRPSEEGKLSYTLCVYHADIPDMFGKMSHVLGGNGINIRAINSEQLVGDGKVVTNYTLHQPIASGILDELRRIEGVQRVLFSDPYAH